MSKNLEHRQFGSTMRLVVGVWLTATALLVSRYIGADEWVQVTIAGVFGWVLRDGAAKAAEAYRDRT